MAIDTTALYPESRNDKGTWRIVLSVYIILLSFFILLVAKSEFQEGKMEEATESIAESFGIKVDLRKLSQYGEVERDGGLVRIYNHIKQSSHGQLQLQDATVLSSSNRVLIEVNTRNLFFRDQLSDDASRLFRKIIDLARKSKTPIRYEILVDSVNPINDKPITVQNNESLARVGVIARGLMDMGVERSQIYPGLRQVIAASPNDSKTQIWLNLDE
jgi:hypothetical protein